MAKKQKLFPDDKGPLKCAMFIKNDQIVVNFAEEVKWLSMGAKEADTFIKSLQSMRRVLGGTTELSKAVDKVQQERVEHFYLDNTNRIAASDVFVAMLSGKFDDPVMAMQVGIAVMMNKPIYLLVNEGTPVPSNLRRVAKKVEIVDYSDQKAFDAAIKRITEGKG